MNHVRTLGGGTIEASPMVKLDGIVSIPLGFIGAVLGTLLRREPEAERKFTELSVRANTGLGAERAASH